MKKTKSFRSRDDRIFDFVVIFMLLVLTILFILPFLNVVSMSISDEYAIMRGEVTFFPVGLSTASYRKVFKTQVILNSYANTVFIAAFGCVLSLVMTCFAAYPLVFAEFCWKKMYSVLIMFTMWFSGGLVPTYLVMNRFRLIDNLWVLILINLISPYHVLVLKSYFSSLPRSVVESAKIDGANDLFILFKIIMPLAKAALATISLWVVVLHWNDYLNPLVYLRSTQHYTLQLVLRDIILAAESSPLFEMASMDRAAMPEQLKYAVLVFVMAPMVIIYPFFQKYFVKGVMIGAVKG